MQGLVNQILLFLPVLGLALLILVGGWFLALILSGAVRKVLERTTFDDRLAANMGIDTNAVNIEQVVGKGIYYLVMLFVIIATFETLGLTIVTDPLNNLLTQLLSFVPNLLAAGILLAVAWLVATGLKFLVSKGLGAAQLDDKLSAQAGLQNEDQPSLSDTLANVVYWFIFLLFLPAILGALEMQGLLAPVQGMLDDLLGFLPNILGASLIVLVGWFVARIIRQIVTGLLVALGTDRLGERVGLGGSGSQSLSGIVGTVLYALVLIPAIIAGLNALQIRAISEPATNMLTTLMDAIPNIFGAMIILGVTYLIAKLVAGLVTNVLTSVGFNKVLGLIGVGAEPEAGQWTPADVVGYLIMVALMIFATIEAAEMLGFGIVATLVAEFFTFASQVILGVIIFGLGLYLANLVSRLIMGTAGANANLLSQAARAAIIVLAAAMGLRRMGIADDIVNLAFGLMLGAIALAVALAFGLGARQVAARETENLLAQFRGSSDESS